MQHTKIGCEIFIIKDNQILLGKRKDIFGDGTWALPGGHLEWREKVVEGAKRELKEELGIENAELELIAITDDVQPDEHYVHVSFKLTNFDGKYEHIEKEFCSEWKFFDLDNLPENIFFPHKKIFKTFNSKRVY